MTQVAEAAEVIPVLWMDDEPRAIENFRDILAAEKSPLRVDIATTIHEARERLREKEYGALVIDCRMDLFGRTENGAKFLQDVNEERRALPTFVFTGYADDPMYSQILESSLAVQVFSKNENFSLPLMRQRLFKCLQDFGRSYLDVAAVEPEKVTFKTFIKNPEKYESTCEAHWPRHGHWLTKEMERSHLAWVVVCGDRIVKQSSQLSDFPDDGDLLSIGKSYNLVPFAYTAPFLPEEMGLPLHVPVPVRGAGGTHDWAETSTRDDFYPALSVSVSGAQIKADFDTGAQVSFFPEEIIPRGLFRAWRSSHHLGQQFKYFARKVEVDLHSATGTQRSGKLTVQVVRKWSESPFVAINQGRKALIGRDVLLAFDVVVSLCSRERCTGVYYLDELRQVPKGGGTLPTSI